MPRTRPRTVPRLAGRTRRIALLAVLVLLAVAFLRWGPDTVEHYGTVGAANKAKALCSAVFVSGRDPEAVLRAELGSLLLAPVGVRVDRPRGQVTGSLLWVSETVQYRPGAGCTRLADGARISELEFVAPPAPRDRGGESWPSGNAVPEATLAPERQAALDAAVAAAFDAPVGTRAIVVVRRGELVAERYADGFGPETPLTGWSMGKSLTNALIGVRVGEGALALRAPAPVPAWADDPERAGITLDALLRMSSGLAFDEDYGDYGSDAMQMLFGDAGRDMAAFAASRPLAHQPDTHWAYSSGTTNLLQRILVGTFEDPNAAYGWMRRRVLDRIGMTRTLIEPDLVGTPVGSSFAYGTARDWARLGLLFLNDGVWEGERILPRGWVAYSTTPTPDAPRGRYGAQWWLNRGAADDPQDRDFPMLPRDTFLAAGFDGQNVVVVPSEELVVVRLGYTPGRKGWDIGAFVRSVIDALR
jgi:CubicO group peptidase (beta-lactamase class C family)